MLETIIQYSIRHKFLVVLAVMVLIVGGLYSLRQLPIDAVPDITNNQVQVVTISPSLAPQEIEQFVTFPVELAMANIQDVVEIRSVSKYGLSVVTIVFEDHIPILDARQLVNEQIQLASSEIPEGFGQPEMMPITTGLGEIFQYILQPQEGYAFDPMELRTIQDWIVKRYLSGIPGVVEVSSFGGFIKQYEVAIRPERLRGMDLTLHEVHEALRRNNQNTGGSYIEQQASAFYIRTEGLVKDPKEIGKIVVANREGVPILVQDIAEVRLGYLPRFGAMTANGQGEVVGGITLMYKGANSNEVIGRVKERIEAVQDILPEGLEIQSYLDRSSLIQRTILTVRNNLVEGGLIVVFILVLLLGNLRAGLIVASVIPLSMLFAFSMMHLFGVSANLMSLGAIDFGLIVDGAVIVVESIIHQLSQKHRGKRLQQQEMDQVVFTSTSGILRSATFGVLIILMVYLPLLALEGIEGKMFVPMAQTVSFALMGALILSLTYVPMVSSWVLAKKVREKESFADRLIARLQGIYRPILAWALKARVLILSLSGLAFAGSLWLLANMGGEFIPQLEEGDLAMQMAIEPGSSLSQSVRSSTQAEHILLTHFPEIKQVVSKIGTAEVPTDPMSVEDADIMIIMKDKKDWVSAKNRYELVDLMKEKLETVEGASFEFTQPIELRFNELLTGAKADVAVKIYGEDLGILAKKGEEAATLIRNIPGAGDVKVDRTEGFPQIVVSYYRERMAKYGLDIETVNQAVRAAFAGEVAGILFEGERRFDLVVRFHPDHRKRLSDIKSLFIRLPNGQQLPIEEVANIRFESGPMQISRDATKRYITVGVNVRDRDTESLVEEIAQVLDQELNLPPGYALSYGGEFENLQSAMARLSIAVPAILFIIFSLLFITFNSLRQALLIFTAIPLAAIGGILALWVRDLPFSISAGVGFIALFGVAVLNGIVLIGYFNQLKQKGMHDITQRIFEGTRVRMRPVIMTASVASLGFLPMALSTSAGAEVQRPLATVVIGGLITATFLTLLVLPLLYRIFDKSPKSPGKANLLILLLGLGLAWPQDSPAQSTSLPLDLHKAMELMQERNPELQRARLQTQQAEQLVSTGIQIPSTEVMFQRGQLNGPPVDNYWQINQDFGQIFTYGPRKQVLKQQVQVSAAQEGLRAQQLKQRLAQTYYQWRFALGRLSLLQEQDSLFREMSRITRLRHEAGSDGYLALMRAEARVQELATQKQQAQADAGAAMRRLNQLMYLDTTLSPVGGAMEKAPVLFQRAEPDSLWLLHPGLRVLNAQMSLAEQETRLAKSQLSPNLELGYFNQQIFKLNNFDGFFVSLKFPLWFVPARANIQAANIQQEMHAKTLALQHHSLNQEYLALMEQYQAYAQSLNYYENRGLDQAQLVIDQANINYQQGEIDYFAYLQSVTEALQIRFAYLEALFRYNQTVSILNYFSE